MPWTVWGEYKNEGQETHKGRGEYVREHLHESYAAKFRIKMNGVCGNGNPGAGHAKDGILVRAVHSRSNCI